MLECLIFHYGGSRELLKKPIENFRKNLHGSLSLYMQSRLASEYTVILAGQQLNSQDLLCSWSLMVEINITEISRTACNREVTDSRMQISSGEINDQEQLS